MANKVSFPVADITLALSSFLLIRNDERCINAEAEKTAMEFARFKLHQKYLLCSDAEKLRFIQEAQSGLADLQVFVDELKKELEVELDRIDSKRNP